MKEDVNKNFNTEFHNEVFKKLKEFGFTHLEENKVAVSVDNKSDVGTIYYNFLPTSIVFNRSDFEQIDVEDAGFKYWSTWHWGENC